MGEEEEEGEKKKMKEPSSSKAPLRYGSNLGYELYYESHGFCMGF